MNTTETEAKPEKKLKHNRTGYVRGCRCNDCIEGNREYQRDYMKQWRNKGKETTES